MRLLQVDSVTDALFVKLDTDGDGSISFDEFQGILKEQPLIMKCVVAPIPAPSSHL